MSATNVEKATDAAVNDVANTLSNTSINDKAAANEAASASAAEGRRLYIGNLAYPTTEGELKDFFKNYLVYVHSIKGRSLMPPAFAVSSFSQRILLCTPSRAFIMP